MPGWHSGVGGIGAKTSPAVANDTISSFNRVTTCRLSSESLFHPTPEWDSDAPFLDCFSCALETSERAMDKVAMVSRFWQRFEDGALNPRQRKVLQKLLEAEPEGFIGGLSNKKYRGMTTASQATAARDLSELVTLGALYKVGAGRSLRYELSPL
jgi:hypothetical protein